VCWTVVIEESAYQMVSDMTVDRTNAVQKIMDGIYMHNKENTDIVSSICTLFIELSHYGQISSASSAKQLNLLLNMCMWYTCVRVVS